MVCLDNERFLEEWSGVEQSRREARMRRKWIDFQVVWIKRSKKVVEKEKWLCYKDIYPYNIFI